jgi:hypothetical protein
MKNATRAVDMPKMFEEEKFMHKMNQQASFGLGYHYPKIKRKKRMGGLCEDIIIAAAIFNQTQKTLTELHALQPEQTV